MKATKNKQLEKVVDKWMQEDSLQTPSLDFTQLVMSQVETVKISTSTVYKPIISKTTWAILGVVFVLVMGYIISSLNLEGESSVLHTISIPEIDMKSLVPSFKLSSVMLYALAFFSLMVGVQIPLLKRYFEKRLDY